jgi:hypothetical protein
MPGAKACPPAKAWAKAMSGLPKTQNVSPMSLTPTAHGGLPNPTAGTIRRVVTKRVLVLVGLVLGTPALWEPVGWLDS